MTLHLDDLQVPIGAVIGSTMAGCDDDRVVHVEANRDRGGEPVTMWSGQVPLRDLCESWPVVFVAR